MNERTLQSTGLSSEVKLSRLRNLLRAGHEGKRPLGLYLTQESPALIEIAALVGVEYLIVNFEHSAIIDRTLVYSMARTADLMGLPFFVKLEKWDPYDAAQMLDSGACGICVPNVQTAEHLRSMCKETQFPPAGSRGYCSVSRAGRWDAESVIGRFDDQMSYFELQKEAMIIPFIESAEALRNIDSLLDVEEVPWYMIGSADLAFSLSKDGIPDIEAAMEAHKMLGEKAARKKKLLSFFHQAIPFASADTPHNRSPQIMADFLVSWQNSMPWVVDVWAYTLGLDEARRTRDLSLKNR